jgi:hypothetical protein
MDKRKMKNGRKEGIKKGKVQKGRKDNLRKVEGRWGWRNGKGRKE